MGIFCSLIEILVFMSVIQDGYSALLGAAEGGYTDTVAELVKAKANVNLQNIVCQYLDSCSHPGYVMCTRLS